ncbi:MAG TPA: hypothetical protein VN625_05070 [Desulfuromonadaceae bacterium]|nr:hypothetical protein [Desulfuromonadaceae bacterium]
MAKRKLQPHGRITQNTVTPEEVDERARELSLIRGHEPSHRTTSDLRQAKRELRGDDAADAPDDDQGIMASGMGAPPTSRGKKIEPQLPDDDQDEARLVEEGVDEAGHDQMLEASKRHTRSEG